MYVCGIDGSSAGEQRGAGDLEAGGGVHRRGLRTDHGDQLGVELPPQPARTPASPQRHRRRRRKRRAHLLHGRLPRCSRGRALQHC